MKAVIYTQNNCQFTPQEKTYLASKGVTFEERNVEANKTFLDEMMKLGANFAGTPVTQITKDDGTTEVLKGFTQAEFDAALGGASASAGAMADKPVQTANADMNAPLPPSGQATPPAPDPVTAPTPDPVVPPEPVAPPAQEPMPMPEPTPAPVEPPVQTPSDASVQTANSDMNVPTTSVPDPVVPPTPAPDPMPEPTTPPSPEDSADNAAPVEPTAPATSDVVQTANADMTMPSGQSPLGGAAAPVDQPVAPATSDVVPPMPEPTTPPTPEASADNAAPVVETPAPATQTASNPLDAILADLQQKVSAASPVTQTHSDSSVQATNADMTMPTATPPASVEPVVPPMPEPTTPPSPEAPADKAEPVVPQTPPAPDMPTPPAPSTDLPSVPDFK